MKTKLTTLSALALSLTSPLYAASGASDFLGKAAGYFMGAIGPAAMILGMAICGLYIIAGNRDGVMIGIRVVVGGFVVQSAQWIVFTVQQWIG